MPVIIVEYLDLAAATASEVFYAHVPEDEWEDLLTKLEEAKVDETVQLRECSTELGGARGPRLVRLANLIAVKELPDGSGPAERPTWRAGFD